MSKYLVVEDMRYGEAESYNINTPMINFFLISDLLVKFADLIEQDKKLYDYEVADEEVLLNLIFESKQGPEVSFSVIDEQSIKDNPVIWYNKLQNCDTEPDWDWLYDHRLWKLSKFSEIKSRFNMVVEFK